LFGWSEQNRDTGRDKTHARARGARRGQAVWGWDGGTKYPALACQRLLSHNNCKLKKFKMNIWIVTNYEPLPFADARTRPQRCGMLAKALLDKNHTVELWTSSFDHISHKHLHKKSLFIKAGNRISIQFIKGGGYPHDQSPKRFLHNHQTAREFINLASKRKKLPDVIFAPVPSLELAQSVVKYAKKKGIKVIVDVRDLWPDIYLTMFPAILHPLAKIIFYSEYRRAQYIFKNATAITAVSEAYLEKGLWYAQRKKNYNDRFFPLGSSKINTSSQKKTDKSPYDYQFKSKGYFVATFVGTFSPSLDVQTIIDAARILKTTDKKIKIIIIGAGDRSNFFLEQALKLNNVIMPGWLDSDSIKIILRDTDIGLVSYSKKALMSLPNKPFEYMAAGLPLLSSLKGELETIIQKYNIGLQYDAGDPESLSKQILWLFEHKNEMKKMKINSINLFKNHFESDLVYKNLSEYIEKIGGNDE
jgi:glycosyltransferase involved in cell wall biosynthesis